MIGKQISPSAKLDLAKETSSKLRWHNIAFVLVLVILPALSFMIYHLDWVESKPEFSQSIEAPVAKVKIDNNVLGTAFLITPTKLLTARHVIEDKEKGDKVELFFEKSNTQLTVTATIQYIATTNVKNDSQDGSVPIEYFLTDFAVLSVPKISDIQPLNIGSSIDVQNLDEVVLVGYPGDDYSITTGHINSTTYKGFELFKLDATANPGNSGGPCILKGNNAVVGILVGGSGRFSQGENIALKIDDVVKALFKAKIDMQN